MSEDQQAGAMEEGIVPLNITHQYVKDLSFENPGAPALFLQPPDGAPDIAIEVNVTADQIGENLFEVNLHVEARAKASETVLFITELDYCAIAEVGDIPDEHKQPLILIEVPRMLFPFARAIISNVTRDGGFPPLMISNVDFVEMYRRSTETAE
ncbi:MAG: protein-export chaperone SecB [Pseudomonadota bacterium]|jgi:preprotein translocase subunit SecB|nr:protein-export chaperone SecB [Pseudomonadota bacterium]|tara:strand:- start:89 stop:550 length:462 start_codon:yes stop_codon:yes gene_type:complete